MEQNKSIYFHKNLGWGTVDVSSIILPSGLVRFIPKGSQTKNYFPVAEDSVSSVGPNPFSPKPDPNDLRSWDEWCRDLDSDRRPGGTLLEILEKELDRECDDLLKEMEQVFNKDPELIDRVASKFNRLEKAAGLSEPKPAPKHRYQVGDAVTWVLGPGSPLGEIVELGSSALGSEPLYTVALTSGETKKILEFGLRPWDTKSQGLVFPDAPAPSSPTVGVSNNPRTYPLVPGDAFPKREQLENSVDVIRGPKIKTDIYAMPPFSPNIRKLAGIIHDMNKAKGFWDKERNVGEMLMLVTSELGEAIEAHRKGSHAKLSWYRNLVASGEKYAFEVAVKNTFEDEIADAVIRLLDLCGGLGIDIEEHVFLKMQYNATRSRLHGKKY